MDRHLKHRQVVETALVDLYQARYKLVWHSLN